MLSDTSVGFVSGISFYTSKEMRTEPIFLDTCMSEELPPNHRIDLLCDEFEKKLVEGTTPSMSDFVARIESEYRDRLRQELSALQNHYRSGDLEATCNPESASTLHSSGSSALDATLDSNQGPARNTVGKIVAGEHVRYIGDYEIIEEIARGGMGVVYRARQTSLGRIVALKMILSGELAGDSEVMRFRSEAEAAATLTHPGIVPIYEVGRHNDQHYFSMGLIEGNSLSDRLKDGPIDQREAAGLVQCVAVAIDYAHRKGVVHRDLKPGNILLDEDHQPHITDFGLAKRLSSSDELTTAGQVIGTPAYMPPEQARGDLEAIGPASDIYSLGAILYAALAGRPPHAAGSAIETLRQVIEAEPVSARSMNPSIAKDLETICQKCLSKEPSRRYKTASDLAAELQRFLAGEPILARPISRSERTYRWCRRRPALAGLLATVLLLTSALAIGGPLAAVTQNQLKQIAVDNEHRAEMLARQEVAARQQAEASRQALADQKDRSDHALYARTVSLAYQQWVSGNLTSTEDLLASLPASHRGMEWYYVDSLCHQELIEMSGMRGPARMVAMTPDGMHVVASDHGSNPKTYVWETGSSQPKLVRNEVAIAASRDGSKLAVMDVTDESSLRVIETITGDVICEIKGHRGGCHYACFGGPSDSLLAYVPGDRTTRVWDIDQDRLVVKINEPHRRRIHNIAISSDGSLIAWRRADDGAIELHDISAGHQPFQSPSDERLAQHVLPIAFSTDGEQIAVGGYGEVEIRSSRDGHLLGRLTGLRGYLMQLAFSPDGGRIAVTCEDETIYLFDANRMTLLTRLTGHHIGVSYGINAVAFDAGGDRIISGGFDTAVKVWDAWSGETESIARSKRPMALLPHPSQSIDFVTNFSKPVEAVHISDDGSLLIAGGQNNSIIVVDSATQKVLRQWEEIGENIASIDFDSARKRIVAGGGSIGDKQPGSVIALDFKTDQELWRFDGASGPISRVALSQDGSRLAVSVGGQAVTIGELFVLDANDGSLVAQCDITLASIRDMALSPDGSWIATVGNDSGIQIFDAATCQRTRTIDNRNCFAVAIDPAGKHLVTGGIDWHVRLYDLDTNEPSWSSLRHSGAVSSVAFADDGARVVSVGFDSTTRIWDTKYGDLVLTLDDNGEEKYCVAVSPTGNLIASTGNDSNVIVRRMRSETAADREWITLIEDDFEEPDLRAIWNPICGEWSIKEGRAVAELRPAPYMPGVDAALLVCNTLVSADVEIAYDVQIDSPMAVETKLSTRLGTNAVMAEHIGKSVGTFNRGEKGVSILSQSNGALKEVASRRGEFVFETDRNYRFRARRVGRKLDIYIDDVLYRSAEVPIDVPVPQLMLQAWFGEAGDKVSYDNLVVKIPKGSEAEIQAVKIVNRLFDSARIKPLVLSSMRSMDDAELLQDAGESLIAADIRQVGLQLASDWSQSSAEILAAVDALAIEGDRSQQEYLELLDWLISQNSIKTEEIYRTMAFVAYRANNPGKAWEALKQSQQMHESTHGSKHPAHFALSAMLLHRGGNVEKAEMHLGWMNELMRADHWQRDHLAKHWSEAAREVVETSEDADEKLLAERTWQMTNARLSLGDLSAIERAVTDDTTFEFRRVSGEDKHLVTMKSQPWIETEKLWNHSGHTNARLVRDHVGVDKRSNDAVVTSKFVWELNDRFWAWRQTDVFSADGQEDVNDWKLKKQTLQMLKMSRPGQVDQPERDGWDQLDERVAEAQASGDLYAQVVALSTACRLNEAADVAKQLIEKQPDARGYVLLNELAYQLHDPKLMQQTAKSAIELDPLVEASPYIRSVAARELAAPEPMELPHNLTARPPTFYQAAPLSILNTGDNSVAAWQPTSNSLIGIFVTPLESSLEELIDQMIKNREASFSATKLVGKREITVDGQHGFEFLQAGLGIGWAVASGGKPTLQRFVVVERDTTVVVMLLSAYQEEFSGRNAEFNVLLESIEFQPLNEK